MAARAALPNSLAPADPRAAEGFVPYDLPHPDRYPFRMGIDQALPAELLDRAKADRSYPCYLLADVGGVTDPAPQRQVAAAMAALAHDLTGYDVRGEPCGGTLFAYIVGDVVYHHGAAGLYREQFYTPYGVYPRPIFAVPGNHDGEPGRSEERALAGFVANFCAPVTGPQPLGVERAPIGQPNVYWTLEAPWLRIIGLYTNVPEGGVVEAKQRAWFLAEMARPLEGKHLVVALHQPVFSASTIHMGSEAMLDLIHEPAKRAGCKLVISGHVHNYQRYQHNGVNYLANGAGGYHELHGVLAPSAYTGPRPVRSYDASHSFIHMTVSPDELTLRTVAVPLGIDLARAAPRIMDTLAVGR